MDLGEAAPHQHLHINIHWVLVLIGSHSPRGDLELPFGRPVLEVTQKAEGQAAIQLLAMAGSQGGLGA